MSDDETTLVNQRGTDEFDIDGSSEYREADEYVYVRARGFAGADRKMPITRWVSECPDDVDPRSLDNPHTLAYDETAPDEPHIIVGARDGHMLDIDVDVGDDHAVTFDGDHDAIRTPDGVLAFVSASGGPHRFLKFDRDHSGVSGVEGVDLQGDMDGNNGVVTSPFHHPEYRITDEPEQRVTFDDALESQRLNNALGADLLDFTANEPRASDSRDANPTFEAGGSGSSAGDHDEHLTPEDIADALAHIPTDLGYNDWRAIAFAVHDYDDSATGKRLVADWSRGGAKWDDDSQEQLDGFWEHADANGERAANVTLGTLIAMAEAEGWECPRPPDESEQLTAELKRDLDGDDAREGKTTDADEHWDRLPIQDDKGRIDRRATRRWAAEILLASEDFATPMPQGMNLEATPLFHYWPDEGFFERAGAAWVSRRVSRKVPALESRDIREVVNRVRRASFVKRDTFDADGHDHALINLANGVYDLDTGELLPHSPEYRFRTSIPRSYDPEAECPAIAEFIEDVVPGEKERRTLFEWIGFCLETGYPLHRFLVLYGGGRNGKSAYFRLVSEFLESDNVSGVSLDTIASGGFGVAALDDNMLNIDTESADTRLGPSELNTLKALTGGDRRQVDVKYQEPYEMTNAAKLAFAANNPPRFEEDTDAIADRLLTVEFPFRFGDDANADKPATPERVLMSRLTTDEELSGLLNKALDGLRRVRERGHFTIEEGTTARERFEAYQADADSIVGFADRCLTNETGFAIPKTAVHAAYKAYCADHGHTPAEKRAFFRQLGRKTAIETHSKRPAIRKREGGTERPRVLDHLWVSDTGLAYLSRPAKEDTVRVVEHLYSGNADYANDLLLRTRGTVERFDGPTQEERVQIVRDVIADICDRDDGTEHARIGDILNEVMKAGVTDSMANATLDKLRAEGGVYQPATGQYRIND